jgi:peptidoglycan/LPS O-acetylase OafA/YrhL
VKSTNAFYLHGIDHIRAFAAILVLFHHGYLFIGGRLAYGEGGSLLGREASTPFSALVVEGHTGVSLFMVLSGFIFTTIAYGRSIHYGRFVLNRVLRIYPLMLALFAVGCLVRPAEASFGGLMAVLLIPFGLPHPVDLWFVPDLYPFTTLFWTIGPEFLFYLLFPLLLALVQQQGLGALAFLLLGAVAVRGVLVVLGADVAGISYWTIFGRIDQFLIGIGLAVVYRRRRRSWHEVLWPIALVIAVHLLFNFSHTGSWDDAAAWKLLWPTIEGIVWAVFILGYLPFVERLPAPITSALAAIGGTSFSIYLLHMTVVAALLQTGPVAFGWGAGKDAFLNTLLFILPATLTISWLSFRMIEAPFLRLRVRYLDEAGATPVLARSKT